MLSLLFLRICKWFFLPQAPPPPPPRQSDDLFFSLSFFACQLVPQDDFFFWGGVQLKMLVPPTKIQGPPPPVPPYSKYPSYATAFWIHLKKVAVIPTNPLVDQTNTITFRIVGHRQRPNVHIARRPQDRHRSVTKLTN